MARAEQTQGFYQKMAELQVKLKKSEEERLKLEEKFILMMKSCREEEEMRIRALRERYETFLEEDKKRRDRNERILQTLDRIESRAMALSAKSERLKLLRKHYEAYLIKMYPLWKNPPKYPEEKLPSYPVPSFETPRSGVSNFQLNGFRPESALSQTSSRPAASPPWQPPAHISPVPSYLPERTMGHWQQSGIHTAAPQFSPAQPCDKMSSAVAPGDPALKGYGAPQGEDIEEKSIPIAGNPVLDGALDGYLHRAAELLRAPIQELDGTSEKRDEEKSVHTEQDTSRDLLGVSLSDDNDSAPKEEMETCSDLIGRDTAAVETVGAVDDTGDVATDGQAGTGKEYDTAGVRAEAVDVGASGDTAVTVAPTVPAEPQTAPQLGQGDAGDFPVDQVVSQTVPKPAEPETTHRLRAGAVPSGRAARTTQPELCDEGPTDGLGTQADIAEAQLQQSAGDAVQKEQEYASELGQQEGSDYVQQPLGRADYIPTENLELANEQLHGDAVAQGYDDNQEWYTQEQLREGDSEMITEYDDGMQQEAYGDNVQENYTVDNKDQLYASQSEGQEYTEHADQYANEYENDQQDNHGETTEQQGTDNAETYPEAAYDENVEQPQTGDSQQYTEQEYMERPDEPYVEQQYSDNTELAPSVPADTENMQELPPGEYYSEQPQPETQYGEGITETGTGEEKPGLPEAPEDDGNEAGPQSTVPAVDEGQGESGGTREGEGIAGNMLGPPEGEVESEESSSSFWNPPGRVRGEIPSVDELASNVPALAPEDSSESSVGSRQLPATAVSSTDGGPQPFRKLLGTQSEAAGEPSDADDVEDELAALIKGDSPGGVPKAPSEAKAEALQSEAKTVTKTSSSPKIDAHKKTKLQKPGGSVDKPATKATSKKLPALNRVLESDTESLNLDAGGGSNVESDEFDFSTD